MVISMINEYQQLFLEIDKDEVPMPKIMKIIDVHSISHIVFPKHTSHIPTANT